LAARESEIAFDEYLSGIPDAATDLSLSAEELSRAAARISLDQGQDAVLGVLSRAQTDTIATGRRPRELGPFTPGFGVPAPLLDDQGREGIAPAFDADEFTTKFEDANERAAAEQRQASLDFAENVIDAGSGFINAIESFRSGDIGGGIAGLGGTIGSLFTSIGGALGPIGQVLGPITGLIGGAVSLFSPREADGAGASGQEFDRFSSTPAININVSVEQENTYNGGPTDLAIEQAFLRQTRQVVEEILDRSGLLQELRELKGAT
jgi:hypothetical protein